MIKTIHPERLIALCHEIVTWWGSVRKTVDQPTPLFVARAQSLLNEAIQ